MKPAYDYPTTFGELRFIGKDEKAVYKDGERTDEVQYAYRVSSRAQSEELTIKIPHEVELDWNEQVEIIEPEMNHYVQFNGDFAKVAFSIKAKDIKSKRAGANSKNEPKG
ncbi:MULTISPECIES: DUF961 family protein [Staphylococcus]|uniref:DUF961 family protein n=1 Tax=Staphylococcus TaxID=1279 RepID=UPI0005C7D116|nr:MULTISPECIES: DUF961 family protein [Staphylococcus]MDG4944217.1 DUF961 family protein [Staphylococcus agnetis]HDH6083002.1 DUF961 family protein [Staphylococcus aureus]